MKPNKEPDLVVKPMNFDTLEDLRQGGFQLDIIRYIALGIFLILIGRLFWLQVMNHEVYAERSDQNRIRVLTVPARRGTIYDRKGRILVTSQASYNIVLSRQDAFKNLEEITNLLVENLAVDREWLAKRFEEAKFEPSYENIVVKEQASAADVAWVEAHEYDYPMIRAEEAPQRLYLFDQLAAHALGYVGEVNKKELNEQGGKFSKERGFKLGDIIGKFGIERSYNDILMGKDGERRVLVDSRGRIQQEIEVIPPVPGRDLYSALDLDIQQMAEAQTDTMPSGRGAIVVVDPNNGEVLAMVSHPAFDPNTFSQRAKTPEGKEEIRSWYEDPDKPLYNRVIQGQFPPGSTWKLMTTVAALNEGVITPTDSKIQDGGILLGTYYMNSLSHMGFPEIIPAIRVSADGYFYRLGLKMGVERFEKWVNIFQFGQRTGIDLPNEKLGIPPTRATKSKAYEGQIRRAEKEAAAATDKVLKAQLEFKLKQLVRYAQWTDYDMCASSFGQGMNATTPIQLARYTAALANGGQMYTPHLLLKAMPGLDREGQQHGEITFEDKTKFTVPMSPEIHHIVKQGMWQAANAGGGTAGAAAVPGFDVCAKTGTAQVASNERAGKENKDHAWLISFAPRDKPELAMVILTENAGFGGKQSAPRAKPIYEDYVNRTRGAEAAPVVAQK